MCSAGDKVFLWSDEKIFTLEPQMNSQNEGMLSASSPSIALATQTVQREHKHAWVRRSHDLCPTARCGIQWAKISLGAH